MVPPIPLVSVTSQDSHQEARISSSINLNMSAKFKHKYLARYRCAQSVPPRGTIGS